MTGPELFAGVRTPALVVDEAAVERNIRLVLTLTGSPDRWRAHVKTAKARWAMERLIAFGVRRFKASTTAELATLLSLGAPDVLLAYPAVGPTQWRAAELATAHPGAAVSVLADSVAGIRTWRPGPAGAFIDVDTGMGRTGVPAGDHRAALAVADELVGRGIPLRGLHGYDGHLADLPPPERDTQAADGLRAMADLAEALQAAGHPIGELVAGGSHTFREILATPTPWLDRVTVGAGTVVYNDARSLGRFGDIGFTAAAVVLTRVVSRPGPGRITVDAGLTAIQVDAGRPHAEGAGLAVVSAAQEHLVLSCARGTEPGVGDLVTLVPRHVDTTVAQFGEMHVIGADGRVRVEPVTARHHESASGSWGLLPETGDVVVDRLA
ncbi:D-TA family PLP-dependent enzyme [Acrocarpospora macrocephala]|uniref:Threonine aldolase n=1 Tax=Acrocarpospora macrocephala TaxID=150177 RepID=A0A5M3WLP0_9ACTN|nr:alanine racemase [Acrocarpospora macrocephala]GES09774.1 threonine aldolase [Acrocarpospora macrocephala]